MKRNWSKSHKNAKAKKIRTDNEEARLSDLLFHKSNNLPEKLKSSEHSTFDLDLKPAWIDEDDEHDRVETTAKNAKSKTLYTDKLKQKYETVMGAPTWAKIRPKTEDDDKDDTLRRVGHLDLKKKNLKDVGLKPQVLEIKQLPRLNNETRNEGKSILSVEFHPKLSVVLVGGNSGVVSLLSVAGVENKKLHSFKLKKWKIDTARFTPDGTHAFISSPTVRNQYCYYDLVKAMPEMVDFPTLVKHAPIFELSYDGKYIATSDGFDEVLIISAISRELIRRLKNNSKIVAVCFSHNSEQIYCYGVQGEVTLWDLSTFRSFRKFYDQGCVKGSIITSSLCGRLLATGSGEGIVNIYETSALKETTTYNPDPLKIISNLTTKITGLKFNATTELLAITSNVVSNAGKLVHIPSYTVFQNFPNQERDMGSLNCVAFSPNSGYMGLGNGLKSALLFRLKHYKNY